MKTIDIETVTISDIDQLQEIGKQTFYETFSSDNKEEDMNQYLQEGFSKEKLSSEINDTNTAFFFAKIEDKVVGYLKLNFGASQTELKDDKALEIERIYVAKEFHGKDVGQMLYEKAIEVAIKKGGLNSNINSILFK